MHSVERLGRINVELSDGKIERNIDMDMVYVSLPRMEFIEDIQDEVNKRSQRHKTVSWGRVETVTFKSQRGEADQIILALSVIIPRYFQFGVFDCWRDPGAWCTFSNASFSHLVHLCEAAGLEYVPCTSGVCLGRPRQAISGFRLDFSMTAPSVESDKDAAGPNQEVAIVSHAAGPGLDPGAACTLSACPHQDAAFVSHAAGPGLDPGAACDLSACPHQDAAFVSHAAGPGLDVGAACTLSACPHQDFAIVSHAAGPGFDPGAACTHAA